MTYREQSRANSNNPENTNKNACAYAVAYALTVENETRYLHNINDLKRAVSAKWSLRSVKSMVKSKTVGGARAGMQAIDAVFFLIHVDGHVLLADADGNTVTDTDKRKADRRKIKGVWALNPKR